MLNADFYRCQVKFNVMFAIRSTKSFLRKKSNGLGVTVVILGFTLHAWVLTSEPETFLCSECCEKLNSLKIYTKYSNDICMCY